LFSHTNKRINKLQVYTTFLPSLSFGRNDPVHLPSLIITSLPSV